AWGEMKSAIQMGMWVLLLVAAASVAGRGSDLAPAELVRRTVRNETENNQPTLRFMFRDRKQTAKGSQTKLMVETREAMAGMVIAVDDKPLGPAARQQELARIERFVNDPGELNKKRRQEKEDEERVTRIVRALPDAFLYQYDGTETGTEDTGRAG